MSHHHHTRESGSMIILTLVFSAVFVILLGSLVGLILQQKKTQDAKVEQERAFSIAEAGLEYYQWFLAHYPTDLTNGTGTSGPYIISYDDPESGAIGTYSLDVEGTIQCGAINAVDIRSTGWTNDAPQYPRTVFGRYSRPTVANYSRVINTDAYMGASFTLTGPLHANGGVNMGGTNYSLVTSAQSTWNCTSSYGCSPSDPNAPGVTGSGPNSHLWQFPVPTIDFIGISVDLSEMKDLASSSGLYFPSVSNQDGRTGYHLNFLGDGTVDIYQVTNADLIWSYHTVEGWDERYDVIDNETFLGNYAVPTDCSLIYVEDKVWIEGTISGKVTVAVADLVNPGYEPEAILNDNILYTTYDGTDGLALVAEKNIRLPIQAQEDTVINGIFVAQTGNFGRNYYTTSGSQDVPSAYNSKVKLNTLNRNGTVVSNQRIVTSWGSSSGYNTVTLTYDQPLSEDPPPFTPPVSDDFFFVLWRDES